MKSFFTAALFFLVEVAFSQTNFLHGLDIGFDVGSNYSFLTYNISDLDQRVSPEIRIGVLAQKSLNQRLAVQSALRIGIKPKTTTYYVVFPFPTSPTQQLLYLQLVDVTLSERDHYFIEVPIALAFRLKKFQVGGGMLTRYYLKNAALADSDFLSGNSEAGLCLRVSYNLGLGFSANAEGYFGMTPIFNQFIVRVSTPPLIARSNFIGLSLGYYFRQAGSD